MDVGQGHALPIAGHGQALPIAGHGPAPLSRGRAWPCPTIIRFDMPLAPGTRLEHYEISGPLGAGGMGEVYRALDTKLKREVALKILPPVFAQDPSRLARFEREAQVLAALNHPNIAAIYGLENADGVRFLVLELVEGPTLAQRLETGAIPLDDALAIARQITDAVEAAHDKGIVHRDLKPANVKVTPDGKVKVLDFGLAAMTQPAASATHDPSTSPTLTMGATQAGVILGTAAYMSPEQARGQAVDKRGDIWSFGVLFYEMVTGKKLFTGDTISDTLASVLKEKPDLEIVPVQVRRLVESCLEKDPRKRLRDIGDVWRLMDVEQGHALLSSSRGMAPRHSHSWIWPVAVAAPVLALAGLAFVHYREKPPAAEMYRFEIGPPEGATLAEDNAISPDGRKLAFLATGKEGKQMIWVRSLNAEDARPLPGTEDIAPSTPIWSPDSRSLAFVTRGALKKIEVAGGPAQVLCPLSSPTLDGFWTPDNRILFGGREAIQQVSASGGAPTPVTVLDQARGETLQLSAVVLPDGHHLLYTVFALPVENSGVYMASLDAKPEQQKARRLLSDATAVSYVPSPTTGDSPGFLIFIRGVTVSSSTGTLMAQPFDPQRLEFKGEAVPIAEQVNAQAFSASLTGVLAYRNGGAQSASQLTWFDRKGAELGKVGEVGEYFAPAFAPDASRVAYGRGLDLWLLDIAGGRNTKFTFGNPSQTPAWSADGSRVLYISPRGGGFGLYQKASNLAGEEELIYQSVEPKGSPRWSHDGKFIIYDMLSTDKGGDIMVLPTAGSPADRKPMPFVHSDANEIEARFSPNDHWVAYRSNQSGKDEIYVRPFDAANPGSTAAGGVQLISKDGGMMAVSMTVVGGVIKGGTPQRLFKSPVTSAGTWDVTADGKRFLIAAPAAGAVSSRPYHVVVNWTELLKR